MPIAFPVKPRGRPEAWAKNVSRSRLLGFVPVASIARTRFNTKNQFAIANLKEIKGISNRTLSGVSRDASGAPLGNVRVLVFRTSDNAFIAETLSDASGNWSLVITVGGPFFLVEYLAGAPDVFGTSPNNLVPV